MSDIISKKYLAACLAASMTLGGCFDAGSSDDDDEGGGGTPPNVTTTLSGKVADGYLVGARVCLDLNANKVCDLAEPTAQTGANGAFTLEGATQAQLDEFNLVVEVIAGQTIDEDSPDETIDQKYTLTAPPGYEFISPLTTMVQNELDSGSGSITVEEAEALIQNKLGTTLDLEADYVEGADGSGTEAEEFERLHKVAQVTVNVLQDNIESVEAVVDNSEVTFEQLVDVIVTQVLDALETIVDEVDTAIAADGDNFDPDLVAEKEDITNAADVNVATVEEEIAANEAEESATEVSMTSVLSNGGSFSFFDADHEYDDETQMDILELGYGDVTADGTAVSIERYNYDSSTSGFVLDSQSNDDGDTEKECILSNNSWTCIGHTEEALTVDGTAIKIIESNLAITENRIEGVSSDITGLKVASMLDDEWLEVMDPLATFSASAVGFQLSFNRVNDIYKFWHDNVSNVDQCGHQDATDVLCNNVHIKTLNTMDHESVVATSFTQLLTLPTTDVLEEGVAPALKGVEFYGDNLHAFLVFNAQTEAATSGTLDIHSFNHDPAGTLDKLPEAGSWSIVTVQNQQILTYEFPLLIQQKLDDDDRHPIFVAYAEGEGDVYLRRGELDKAGVRSDDDWVFNAAAKADILAAFDYSLITPLMACETGNSVHSTETDEIVKNTLLEFDTAVSSCLSSADAEMAFTAGADVEGKTLITDFGFLKFDAAPASGPATGTFFGEVNDGEEGVLDFTWTFDNTKKYVVITAEITGTNDAGEAETEHANLIIARIEANAKEASFKVFSKEAATAEALTNATGEISGEIWRLN